MKSIITTLLIILLFGACAETPKNYATVSGQISNPNKLNKITISNRAGFSREIKVNEDGTFSDTLKVEEGIYRFFDGKEMGSIFLKNNNTISLSLDTNAFDETLKFKGDGADKSNFIITKSLLQEKYLTDDVFNATENEFLETFDDLYVAYNALKEQYPLIDTAYFEVQDKGFESMKKAYTNYFEGKIEMRKLFAKGTPSPAFSNYENDNGSKSSLSDFRGKFVYIDVWATWCGPCKAEIPSLKKLESQYKTKNIEFISISVDDARRSGSMEKAHTAWKTMVKDKQLTGTQLFTGNGWKTDFIQDFKINAIPRFLLIDPKGDIIDADAPRPSSKRLIELLNELGV
jgi:thiol-disulfide isomerase/thioredoxin|tara:strand:+ start:1164 stop:2198 length:1035 start_codon:yes stop_codon:yes gene_type:complete